MDVAHQWTSCRSCSLSETPSCLNSNSTTSNSAYSLNTCVGNPESKFVELGMARKNHQFLSLNKEITAYVDCTCS